MLVAMNPDSELKAATLDLHALTSPGTERSVNEDHCFAGLEGDGVGLVLVADGVSGQNGGEVASQTAVEIAVRAYREEQARSLPPANRLRRAVQHANVAIYDRALAVTGLLGMATTMTAALVENGRLTVLQVGDSRAYLLRAGRLRQLTKDHTLAARRSYFAWARREPPRYHPDRSVLTRALGRDLFAAVDRVTLALLPGDALVVCSDGLYNVLEDPEIAAVVGGHGAQAACRQLIDRANERGTPDNLTVAVLQMPGSTVSAECAAPAHPQSRRRSL